VRVRSLIYEAGRLAVLVAAVVFDFMWVFSDGWINKWFWLLLACGAFLLGDACREMISDRRASPPPAFAPSDVEEPT
jgi:hypothetical protein